MKTCLRCAHLASCIQMVKDGQEQENVKTCGLFAKDYYYYGVCEITKRYGKVHRHHINTRGAHPSIKFDLFNLAILSETIDEQVHNEKRQEITFKLFETRYKNPGWHEWQLKQGSKLYVKFLEAKCEN